MKRKSLAGYVAPAQMDKGHGIGYPARGVKAPPRNARASFSPLSERKYFTITATKANVALAWSLHNSNKPQDEEQP
jgi:hypothetical protein